MAMIDTKTARVYTFDSISEYGRYVAAAERRQDAGDSSRSNSASAEWDLGWGFDRTVETALQGGKWADGAKRLRAALDEQLALIAKAPAAEEVLSVAGYLPDVPAMLSGHPAHMWTVVEDEQASRNDRVVRIAVNASYGSMVNGQCVLNRGAAILAMIDEMEAAGLRVELISSYCATYACTEDGREWYANVIVKQAAECWSVDSVAFAICHPAFSRRLGFALKESCEHAAPMTRSDYGNGVGCKGDSSMDAIDIFFPRMSEDSGFHTPEQALSTVRAFITKALKKEDKQ